MVVLDTTVETVIPRVISSNKRSGGTSVISSLTSENAATSNGDGNDETGSVANDDETLPTPRRLLEEEENDAAAPPSKKSRRSTRDVHATQAEKAKRKRIESLALKVAMRRVNQTTILPRIPQTKGPLTLLLMRLIRSMGATSHQKPLADTFEMG